MAVPTKDTLFVPYSTNVNDRLSTSPGTFNVSTQLAGSYKDLHQPYVDGVKAVADARAAGMRSESLTSGKDAAKLALLRLARQIYTTVQADDSVSDADKILLGVHVRETGRTPVGPPTVRPGVDVVSSVGRTVTVSVHDSASDSKRSRPENTICAFVYSFVGDDYPTDPAGWTFCGSTSKPIYEIQFPDTTPAGSQVWVCATWVSRRQETGPVSLPVTVNLPGGGMMRQAA